jgi:UDP-2,4-diacetamido-2,4,6-trideoxy-beta-L-altropyranose hydrolase
MAECDEGLAQRLEAEGLGVTRFAVERGGAEDARETAGLAGLGDVEWIVVDGYVFGADYQDRLSQQGHRVLFVDDNGHAPRYSADVILNQNVHASAALYASRKPHSRLLLGQRYALLRREFWDWQDWKRTVAEQANKVLIALGGADAPNATLQVLRGIRKLSHRNLEIKVAIGPSNPHRQSVQEEARLFPAGIELLSNVQDMPSLMAWCDIAIAGAGSMTWELAAMQTPCVLLIIADNQVQIARKMEEFGAASIVDCLNGADANRIAGAIESLLESPDLRARMSELMGHLVDGKGVWRVLDELSSVSMPAALCH